MDSLQAQTTVLTLDTSQFNAYHKINLTTAQEWLYHIGHNPDWANPSWNTDQWIKKRPGDLTGKDADKTGRVEGWFRIRLQLDSSFMNIPVYVQKYNWAAIDLYLDGKPLASFGHTGADGQPYTDHYSNSTAPLLLNLTPHREYLLAIHFVEHIAPYSSQSLKSESDGSMNSLLFLLDSTANNAQINDMQINIILKTLWATFSLIMTLFLWFLPSQNGYERQVTRLLAIWGSLITVHNLVLFMAEIGLPFAIYFVTIWLAVLLYFVTLALLTISLFRILGRPLPAKLNFLIVTISLIGGVWSIYTQSNTPGSIANVVQSGLFLYLLISSRKNLRGAQWAIVVGALLTIFFYLAYAVATFDIIEFNFFFVISGSSLSLPVCLIIYIILRFREMLVEVRQQAAAVVQVTEEKRELLAIQNQVLEQQVEARTTELNQTLTNLRSTQSQLIQKEKLAGLGELTAGIAHEIQNPLNFVNNFSEVSTELVEELKEGPFQQLPDSEKGYAEEILGDLKQNLQKINHHGGRASSIVKGMLEHSRTGSGQRVPADLNKLADEYLRLSYHGMRAKDKNFQSDFELLADPDLPLVNVVPQEIGRVLLNLLNNAFYAVKGVKSPKVMVMTSHTDQQVIIKVQDNGTGIPDLIKAKIFQPFFTTKPTGEGTGLGLSLSYDIVTKGHGGTMEVESIEGEGTTFIVKLPIQVL